MGKVFFAGIMAVLLFSAGCPRVDTLYPVLVAGSPRTFALEKKWWDKDVVEVQVLTWKEDSAPAQNEIVFGVNWRCRDAENLAEALGFDTAWRIRATKQVSAKDFKVVIGFVPEGFEQVWPESEPFMPAFGKPYFIFVCAEPINDSVYSVGRPWISYVEGREGYKPESLSVKGPYTHRGSNIVFPEQVGLFSRAEIISYAPGEMDVGVGYNLEGVMTPVAATVYVYPSLPATAEEEFEETLRAMITAYKGAKVVTKEEAILEQGGRTVRGLRGALEYKEMFAGQRQELSSWVYLFRYGDWSVKYRISSPKRIAEYTGEYVKDFLDQFKW